MSLDTFFLLKSTQNLRHFELEKEEIEVLRMHAASIIHFYQSKTDNENKNISKLELEGVRTCSKGELTKKLSKMALMMPRCRLC